MVKEFKEKEIALAEVCKQHYVALMSIFGSAVKGTFTEESDIDLLVLFTDDLDVLDYADNYFSLLENLELLFGKKVDLLSIKSIKNSALREEIFQSKIDLYAAQDAEIYSGYRECYSRN